MKENLEAKDVTECMKTMVTVSFSRSAYVPRIPTPAGKHDLRVENEVEVPDTKVRYLQRAFFTAIHGKGKPRFETVMLQPGQRARKE